MTTTDATTRSWIDELPALGARLPPYPLLPAELQQAVDEEWGLIDKLRLYTLTPAQRDERMGKNPLEMMSYVTEVMVALHRHPRLFQGAPYGEADLNQLEGEIEELGRLRIAAEAFFQAVVDTTLDRQARRYILCGFLVDDLKAKATAAFTPDEVRKEAHQALGPILAIEEAQKARAKDTHQQKQHVKAQQHDQVSRLQAQLQAVMAENEKLRQKLQGQDVPALPEPPINDPRKHKR